MPLHIHNFIYIRFRKESENVMKNQNRSIQTIFDMLDLFYANKHMHDRLRKQDEERAKRAKQKIK
jgi:hypothetical protein